MRAGRELGGLTRLRLVRRCGAYLWLNAYLHHQLGYAQVKLRGMEEGILAAARACPSGAWMRHRKTL